MTTTDDGSTRPPAARRPGRPRKGEQAARRAELLDVATRLFGARGFDATTIEAVAHEAGVTKRTIYSQFTDKAGLFVAAVENLHAHEREAQPDGEDLEDLATRIVHTLHGDQAVTLHRLVIAEAPQFPDLAATFYARGPAVSIEALAAALHGPLGDDSASSAARSRAGALYTLLLGEPHRRRLLGLQGSPTLAQARVHARGAIQLVLGPQPPAP